MNMHIRVARGRGDGREGRKRVVEQPFPATSKKDPCSWIPALRWPEMAALRLVSLPAAVASACSEPDMFVSAKLLGLWGQEDRRDLRVRHANARKGECGAVLRPSLVKAQPPSSAAASCRPGQAAAGRQGQNSGEHCVRYGCRVSALTKL